MGRIINARLLIHSRSFFCFYKWIMLYKYLSSNTSVENNLKFSCKNRFIFITSFCGSNKKNRTKGVYVRKFIEVKSRTRNFGKLETYIQLIGSACKFLHQLNYEILLFTRTESSNLKELFLPFVTFGCNYKKYLELFRWNMTFEDCLFHV